MTALQHERRRALHELVGDHFVADADGFLCESCAKEAGVDFEDDAVEVWEVGSAGWLGPCVCRGCKLSIPVIVDGGAS